MSALSNLWAKLKRSKKYREAFVASQLKRGIPTQIRVLRKQRGWNQAELATRSGLTQGAISRAEDPDYGNLTINNILRIAGGFDVAFIGRFVPFSELARWHATLSEKALEVSSFTEDQLKENQLEEKTVPPVPVQPLPAVDVTTPEKLKLLCETTLFAPPATLAELIKALFALVKPERPGIINQSDRPSFQKENSPATSAVNIVPPIFPRLPAPAPKAEMSVIQTETAMPSINDINRQIAAYGGH